MNLKKKNIEDFLIKLVFKKSKKKNMKNIDLFKSNEVDSFSILKIIIQLEEKYQIKFKDNEIFSNKFNTINKISNLVIKKKK